MEDTYLLNKNFVIANQAYDLMKILLDLCQPKDKTSTFPKALYDSYVHEMRCSSIEIFKIVSLANKTRDKKKRVEYIETVLGLAIEMSHLIYYAYERKWISENKHDTIQNLLKSIYSKCDNWQKKYIK